MSGPIKDLKCPRCGSSNIIEYGKIFECIDCHLEFYRGFDEDIPDDNRLSLGEMKSFIDSFLDDNKKKKRQK